MQNSRKRASVAGALFYFVISGLLLTPFLAYAATPGCQTSRIDEKVQLKHVHDGDTLWLSDGRKVRIIGINTPELARDDQPAEPFAVQARDTLRQLLGKSTPLRLRHGKEKTDRYGRLLAHVYLNDGRNVSEWLLQQGLAVAITVPPNLWQAGCYQQAEQQARRKGKGLWNKKHIRLRHADKLPDSTRGFHIIRGKLSRVGQSRSAIWLNFNRRFALRIVREDLPYFTGMDFDKLIGKQLEVRGWVQYHKQQLRMRIRHPAAIHILP